MIESIENGIQLLLTGIVTVIAILRAIRSQEREWTLLALFSGSFFLGDLYWLLFLVFYKKTPVFSFIPDMSWYASFLFLLLLLFQVKERKRNAGSRLLWLIPVFTAGMCAFYMQWGAYLSNLVYAVLMTLILWQAIGGLLLIKKGLADSKCRRLFVTTIVFCAVEYALWTASCFFDSGTLAGPYLWLDLLLSVLFLFFLPAVRKAVDR